MRELARRGARLDTRTIHQNVRARRVRHPLVRPSAARAPLGGADKHRRARGVPPEVGESVELDGEVNRPTRVTEKRREVQNSISDGISPDLDLSDLGVPRVRPSSLSTWYLYQVKLYG